MEHRLFSHDDRVFYINLNKMMEWICETPSQQKNIETTITQIYPIDIDNSFDGDSVQKEITEVKNTLNETLNTFKYDLLKNFFSVLFNNVMVSDGQIVSLEDTGLSLGQTIALNTLMVEGIIVEVNNAK